MATPEAAIDLVVGKAAAFKGTMVVVEAILARVQGRMMGVAKAATLMLGGQIATMAGFVALHARQEEAQIRLAAVLKATGGAAELSARQLQAYATDLQKLTGVGDDVIMNTQAVLATFREIKGDIFRDAIRAILDMSAVLGTDLQGAALQVGKALNNPIIGVSALTRVGVSFTQQQIKMIKAMAEMGDIAGAQRLILNELDQEFKDVAETLGRTTAGEFRKLKEEVGDLGEEIGSALSPMLNDLQKRAKAVVGDMTDWVIANKGLIAGVAKTALGITALVAAMFALGGVFASVMGTTLATALAFYVLGLSIPFTKLKVFNVLLTLTWKGLLLVGTAAKFIAARLLALAISPLGLLLIGLAAIVTMLIKTRGEMDKAAKASERLADIWAKGRKRPRVISERAKELTKEAEMYQRLIDELKRQNEEAIPFIPSLGTFMNPQLLKAAKENIKVNEMQIIKLQGLRDKAKETVHAINELGEEEGRTAEEVQELTDALELQRALLGQGAEAALRIKLAFKGYNDEQIDTIANVHNLAAAEKELYDERERRLDDASDRSEKYAEWLDKINDRIRILQRGLTPMQVELEEVAALGVSPGSVNMARSRMEHVERLERKKALQGESDALKEQLRTKQEILVADLEQLALLRKRTDMDDETYRRRLKQLADENKEEEKKEERRLRIGYQSVAAATARIASAAMVNDPATVAAERTATHTRTAAELLRQLTALAQDDQEWRRRQRPQAASFGG